MQFHVIKLNLTLFCDIIVHMYLQNVRVNKQFWCIAIKQSINRSVIDLLKETMNYCVIFQMIITPRQHLLLQNFQNGCMCAELLPVNILTIIHNTIKHLVIRNRFTFWPSFSSVCLVFLCIVSVWLNFFSFWALFDKQSWIGILSKNSHWK